MSAQFNCATNNISANQAIQPPICSNSSSAFNTYFKHLNSYIPQSTDPVITLKITLHIITKTNNDPTSNWYDNINDNYNGQPALMSRLIGTDAPGQGIINGQTDRYSAQRVALYNSLNFHPLYIYDSKIQYELTNIYFYSNPQNNNLDITNNKNSVGNYIYNNYPERFDEGLPIIINAGLTAEYGFFQNSGNYIFAVFTSLNPTHSPSFFREQLRHEIGHALNLNHIYSGNGSENIDCNINTNPEFLSDVFPSDPINFPNNPPCFTSYEDNHPIKSNNIMGGLPDNLWISPKQMARRYRVMHLSSVRKYAKDMISSQLSHNVNSSQTWDFDIQFYKNIVVKSGNVLTLKCKLAMAIDGLITVERGAKLIIDGGTVTTWCKTGLWQGIEIEGDLNSPQQLNNQTGLAQNHGIVEIKNQGKIRFAQRGITNYLRNKGLQFATTGGIIIGNYGIFEYNAIDLHFKPYNNLQGNDKSNLSNCSFLSKDNLTSTSGQNYLPRERVYLEGIKGITFNNCNFQFISNSISSQAIIGILSKDAIYKVQSSALVNFYNAISVENTNPLKIVSIENCTFANNLDKSVYIHNCFNPQINNCTFYNNSSAVNNVGLYLNYCKNYTIKSNLFTQWSGKCGIGIGINNSFNGAHQIYNNNFEFQNAGVIAMHNNSGEFNFIDGLKINCNNFVTGTNDMDIAITGTNSSVAYDQGNTVFNTPNNATPKDMVRNEYGAYCGKENQWNVTQSPNSKLIIHPSNIQLNTQPDAVYNCGSSLLQITTPNNISFNRAQDCPVNPESSGGNGTNLAQKINNIDSYLVGLMASNQNGKNDFEIQICFAQKILLYSQSDINSATDSIISITRKARGFIPNADVLEVFAYLNKGDKINAINALQNLPMSRNNWKGVLDKLINFIELDNNDSVKAVCKNEEYFNYFQNLSQHDTTEIQGISQAILWNNCGIEYQIPLILPNLDEGTRKRQSKEDSIKTNTMTFFPNPASDILYVNSTDDSNGYLYKLTSALGQIIKQGSLNQNSITKLDLHHSIEGVYFISIHNDKGLLLRTEKVIVKH
jgi:hypothetical protein